jgi:hypothetical protein
MGSQIMADKTFRNLTASDRPKKVPSPQWNELLAMCAASGRECTAEQLPTLRQAAFLMQAAEQLRERGELKEWRDTCRELRGWLTRLVPPPSRFKDHPSDRPQQPSGKMAELLKIA